MMKQKLIKAISCLGIHTHDLDDSDEDDNDFEAGTSTSTYGKTYIWSRELNSHTYGEYSFAVIQANTLLEDQSQVEICENGTFVGVYDGHGSDVCSNFVNERLFNHFINTVAGTGFINKQVIADAVNAIEGDFEAVVRNNFETDRLIAASGSCCLIGVIWQGRIYIANLGDSRAIIASVNPGTSYIVAQQLSTEHNTSIQAIRNDLWREFTEDPQILIQKNNVWRVKGVIQVTRAIGDVYLKHPGFQISPEYEKFQITGNPITTSVLSSVPTIYTRELNHYDRFLIFASDGLWDYLSNQEAVDLVHKKPRQACILYLSLYVFFFLMPNYISTSIRLLISNTWGIARRLVHKAVRRAARRWGIRFTALKDMPEGLRRGFHDDITVVVVFLDRPRTTPGTPEHSVKGFSDRGTQSTFNRLAARLRDGKITNKVSQRAQDQPKSSERNKTG
ncbi:putative protein phosphatase 2C 43 [Bienertia sinuspersici]